MRINNYLALALSLLIPLGLSTVTSQAEENRNISGPFTHENLSLYLIHGTSEVGPVPLTLQEGLEKGIVKVIETGDVNQLEIINDGEDEVFVQSGDIVKGGQQDRVVQVSFLLPAKSGKVPVDAFCVEQGRWNARGNEEVSHFASAKEYMPSREAKLAMKAPLAAPEQSTASTARITDNNANLEANEKSLRQQRVWSEVAKTQGKLSTGVAESVTSNDSETSLQLSLENEKLQKMRADYIQALEKSIDGKDDVLGFVFAVNGKINSADLYPSNGLFRKMWPKLLAASVTEAIGETGDKSSEAQPSAETVKSFLADAETGKPSKQSIANIAEQEVRDSDKSLLVEVTTSSAKPVHRNYLAK